MKRRILQRNSTCLAAGFRSVGAFGTIFLDTLYNRFQFEHEAICLVACGAQARWREVTELSGYPIEMLQEIHTRQLKRIEDNDAALPIS
jgi:hypothetical protein